MAVKRRWVVILAAAIFLLAPFDAHAQKVIILVRHAERLDQSTDSVLSPVGVERAQALANHLKGSGISAIYTSERRRTIQTAEPLANLLKIKPAAIASTNSNDVAARIKRANAGGVVLIVGHSNTLPELIKAFGAVEQISIADPEYDNLFVVVPQAGRPSLLIHLHF